jgi:hypothetical protein
MECRLVDEPVAPGSDPTPDQATIAITASMDPQAAVAHSGLHSISSDDKFASGEEEADPAALLSALALNKAEKQVVPGTATTGEVDCPDVASETEKIVTETKFLPLGRNHRH